MVKECFVKIADKGSGTVIVPELQGYKPKKKNIAGFYLGINRKLSGTSIDCPTTGEMKVVSEDESEYPSFSYNFGTDKIHVLQHLARMLKREVALMADGESNDS